MNGTVFDLTEKPSTWFDLDGGGRVQLRSITADDWKEIRKQTVKKKVDFKKVDGTPARLEYEEVNEELQNELFWDKIIVDWENFFDGKGNLIPCTKENKILLMMRSVKFQKFISECHKTLADDEAQQAEEAGKNSLPSQSGEAV